MSYKVLNKENPQVLMAETIECSHKFHLSFLILYVKCSIHLYLTALFPNPLRRLTLHPFIKKDAPSEPLNYRPISLLNTIGKFMAEIVHKHIFNLSLRNKTITCLQSGIVQGGSTVNHIVSIYDTFFKALDEGKEVRSVLLNISKAFDGRRLASRTYL